MRWCAVHQRRCLLSRQDHSRLSRVNYAVAAVVMEVCRPLRKPMFSQYNRFKAGNGEGERLSRLVNIFTLRFRPHHGGPNRFERGMTSPLPRIPNRTIRRVHVMPWATPIRRIGRALSYYNGREGDDPAD